MFMLKQCISSDWTAYSVQGPVSYVSYRNCIAIESQAVSFVKGPTRAVAAVMIILMSTGDPW